MDSLKRSEGLSELGAISFAVGSMIGAGVFVLSGLVISEAGSGAIVSYLLAGLLITFTGISYAILASIHPEDGGGFLYAEKMLGPFPGFLAGWGMYTFQIIAQSFVLISFGICLELLLGMSFDPRLLALVALIGLSLLNMKGLNEAGKAELALVAAKVLVLIVFVGLAAYSPGDIGSLGASGEGSILAGTAMVMFAYTGFQVVSMMAGEVKESSKRVPRAIMTSILIVMLIYVLVIIALLSANLDSYGDDSVFRAAEALIGPPGATMISAAAVVSTLSAANSGMVGASRIVMEMASEDQLPGRFARSRNGQPFNAILLAAALTSAFIIYGDLAFIIDITNFLVLVTNVLVNLSALMLVLRRYPVEPHKRFFRSPFRGGHSSPGRPDERGHHVRAPGHQPVAGGRHTGAGSGVLPHRGHPPGEEGGAGGEAAAGKGDVVADPVPERPLEAGEVVANAPGRCASERWTPDVRCREMSSIGRSYDGSLS